MEKEKLIEETIEELLAQRFVDTPDRRVLLKEAVELIISKLERLNETKGGTE